MRKIIFLTFIFVFIFEFLLVGRQVAYAQKTEAEKLGFPYAVDFTPAQIRYLKKLPKSVLQKLIQAAEVARYQTGNKTDSQDKLGGLLGGGTAGKGTNQPTQQPTPPTTQPQQNPLSQMLGTPAGGNTGMSPPGSQSATSPQNQDGNQPIKEPPGGSKDTTKDCGGGKESSDAEFKQMLKSAGIKAHGSATFGGILTDSLLMLKELETDCKCKIFVTSSVRAGMSRGGMHGPGTRYFDLGFTPEFSNFIKSKGSGGPCWYTYKGIKMLDEKLCPSKNATGPHWHINGKGWECKK